MKEVVKYVVSNYKNRVLRARCRHCRYFSRIKSHKFNSIDEAESMDYFAQCLTRVDVHGEQRIDHWTSSNAFCCDRFIPIESFKIYIASEQLNLFNT